MLLLFFLFYENSFPWTMNSRDCLYQFIILWKISDGMWPVINVWSVRWSISKSGRTLNIYTLQEDSAMFAHTMHYKVRLNPIIECVQHRWLYISCKRRVGFRIFGGFFFLVIFFSRKILQSQTIFSNKCTHHYCSSVWTVDF